MHKENKPRTVVFLEQFLSGDQLSVFPLSSFIHLVLCDLMFSTMISAKFIFLLLSCIDAFCFLLSSIQLSISSYNL